MHFSPIYSFRYLYRICYFLDFVFVLVCCCVLSERWRRVGVMGDGGGSVIVRLAALLGMSHPGFVRRALGSRLEFPTRDTRTYRTF